MISYAFWRYVRKNLKGILSFLGLTMVFGVGFLAPVLAPFPPQSVAVGPSLSPPSNKYIFGTDDLGRDILSQVIWGARASLLVGIGVAVLGTLVGVTFGAVSGYFGGFLDVALMRVTELFIVFPPIFLALAVIGVLGNSFFIVMIVIAFLNWPAMARIVRSEILSQKERVYVEASRAIGASNMRIIWHEIIPNVIPQIVVNISILMANAILLEAGLSFLGAGDPNVISWGWTLSNAFPFITLAWWMITFPGFALFITALCFNIFGDVLNDKLNPRLKD